MLQLAGRRSARVTHERVPLLFRCSCGTTVLWNDTSSQGDGSGQTLSLLTGTDVRPTVAPGLRYEWVGHPPGFRDCKSFSCMIQLMAQDYLAVACGSCKGATSHEIVAGDTSRWDSDDIWVEIDYQIVRCKGCGGFSFLMTETCSEDMFNDEVESKVSQFPPIDLRQARIDLGLENPMAGVYAEVVRSFNRGDLYLCGVGLRMLIEGTCVVLEIEDGPVTDELGNTARKDNLEGRINGLHEAGHITENQATILHHYRFAGNNVVHDFVRPTEDEANEAINLLESILHNIFAISEKAAQFEFLRDQRRGAR